MRCPITGNRPTARWLRSRDASRSSVVAEQDCCPNVGALAKARIECPQRPPSLNSHHATRPVTGEAETAVRPKHHRWDVVIDDVDGANQGTLSRTLSP